MPPALEQPVGEKNGDDGDGQEEGRHGVDLGRDAHLEHRVDVERERRRSHSGDEGGDDVVVDREGEDEEGGGGDSGEGEREGDPAKGLPGAGPEVARRLGERRIEPGEAGADDDRHVGEAEDDVGDDHRAEREAQAGDPEEGEEGGAQDHLGEDHRQVEESLGGAAAAESRPLPGQGEGRGGAENRGGDGRYSGHEQAVAGGGEETVVRQQPAVPVESEALPDRGLPAGVEGEDREDGDRSVEEEVDEERVRREERPAGPARSPRSPRAHRSASSPPLRRA